MATREVYSHLIYIDFSEFLWHFWVFGQALFIIAESVISDEAPLALDKNIEISLNGTRGKFIDANGDAIGVLIRNLVDNAHLHAPS